MLTHARELRACAQPGCGYACRTLAELTSHMRRHSAERAFACKVEGCTFTCKHSTTMSKHAKHKHGAGGGAPLLLCGLGPAGSPPCTFSTKIKSILQGHQAKMHDPARGNALCCMKPDCWFTTTRYPLLLAHSRHHNGKGTGMSKAAMAGRAAGGVGCNVAAAAAGGAAAAPDGAPADGEALGGVFEI
jgi:hypothetical protein